MKTVVLVVLLTGCGRVGFEARFAVERGDDAHAVGDDDLTGADAARGDTRGDPVVAGDPGDPGDPVVVFGDPGIGDPGIGDPGIGDPGVGDPGIGDPGPGDPGPGDPGPGDPGVGDPAGDGAVWVGPPETPGGIVLEECPSGLCFAGEGIGLSWDATPGATYYEVRWTCSITQEISPPLTETEYADALDHPIGISWTCGFITANYQVCACNLDGCVCAPIPPPVPNTCGGGACSW